MRMGVSKYAKFSNMASEFFPIRTTAQQVWSFFLVLSHFFLPVNATPPPPPHRHPTPNKKYLTKVLFWSNFIHTTQKTYVNHGRYKVIA
jgi:hypothetical protein